MGNRGLPRLYYSILILKYFFKGKLQYNLTSISRILNNVQLTAYDPSVCKNVNPELVKDWRSQICGGNFEGGKSTCKGDSGGGVYIFDSIIKKYIVTGVVSYGPNIMDCAPKGLPK